MSRYLNSPAFRLNRIFEYQIVNSLYFPKLFKHYL
jgi:hypothetical protein